jgi:uncharacterized membrane protein required for colicin V production
VKKYLFYFIYILYALGVTLGIATGNPIPLIICMACAIITIVLEDDWKATSEINLLKKQVDEDERLVKEQYDLAMKNKSSKEFYKFLNDTVEERFKRKMLYEVSRRK